MKKVGGAFFCFPLVLIFALVAHAESDFPPVSPPEAGPTIAPQIAPSPAFKDFYNPPTVPTPPPSPAPLVTPAFVPLVLPPTVAPEPIPTPVATPSPIAIPTPAATPIPVITPSPVPTPVPVIAPQVIVRPKLLPPITLSIFGGGDSISFNEVNNFVGTQLFKSTIYYGGEIRYPFSNDFSFLFRLERMSQSSSVGAAAFSLSSLPVMVGLDYHLPHPRKIRVHLSALVGPAINTNLTETAASLPSPNVTEYSSTAISGMFRLSLEYTLSRMVGIFAEGGYRLLDTSSAAPTQSGAGGTLFQSNGQYQSLPLNLSGPFIGGGFVFVL